MHGGGDDCVGGIVITKIVKTQEVILMSGYGVSGFLRL